MVGIGRGLVILHMARRAGAGGQAVVSVNVALRTLQRDVGAGQGKSGGGVIKSRVPGSRGVTGLTRLREPCLHVVRVARALKIFQVEGHARSVSQIVIAVDVALRARCRGVYSGQREAGAGVIEGGVAP